MKIDEEKLKEKKKEAIKELMEKAEIKPEVDKIEKKLEISDEERDELKERLSSKTLLKDIEKEINKTHIRDEKLKVTLFLVCVSGLLKNPRRRMSMALTSNTSTGKDNLIKSIFSHLPDYKSLFLTGATTSTIEDNINIPILALSEVNLFRKEGANKDILEVIKQRTEGGINKIKKDTETGFKSVKFSQQPQGTTIYGTTDEERDEESETRFIFGSMEECPDKHREVINKTFEDYSNLDNLFNQNSKEFSWLKKCLTILVEDFGDCEIHYPFMNKLKDLKINDEYIFDFNSPRCMRDVKRLLSLSCSVTFLKSFEREKVIHRGKEFLIGEVDDFIQSLEWTMEFFNQSYIGLDKRLQQVLDIINETKTEWIERDFLQTEMGVHRNTIKKYCSKLSDLGHIEGNKGSNLNEIECGIYGDIKNEPLRRFNGNKIYYKRCQKGVKKRLIRCQISELKSVLNNKNTKNNNKIDTFEEINKEKGVKQKVSILKEKTDTIKSVKNDTFELTPSVKNTNSTPSISTSQSSENSQKCEDSEDSEDTFGGKEKEKIEVIKIK